MKSLFDLMNAERKPIALFGGMCTVVNEPVAMASKYWNILQLSYAETHAKFSSADSNEVVKINVFKLKIDLFSYIPRFFALCRVIVILTRHVVI
jgi:hypothetical protein